MSQGGSSRGPDRSRPSKRSLEEDERLALVRWLTGQYEGTMTHNVPLPWIQRFKENYGPDESFTVEWRRHSRRNGQWPLYDCVILDVSDDADFLAEKMAALEARSSPEVNAHHETPVSRLQNLGTNLDSLSQTVGISDLRALLLQTLKTSGISTVRASGSPSTEDVADQRVKRVGKRLLLSTTAYIEAKAAATPSTMTMNLVRATFSKGRLRRSSYAGQKRKDKEQKPSLKQYQKMQDIQDFVKSRFPYFTQAAFGAAVNMCTGSNVDRVKVIQLRDMSDSEEDPL